MANKKVFSTSIDADRIKDLKHLAVDTDKTLGDLLDHLTISPSAYIFVFV